MSSGPFDATSFDDYRALIRAWLAAGRPRTSQVALAHRLRLSRSHVAMVLHGHRSIDPQSVAAWVSAMELTPEEAVHFEALVQSREGPPRGP